MSKWESMYTEGRCSKIINGVKKDGPILLIGKKYDMLLTAKIVFRENVINFWNRI